ncbi:MAG: thioredoxin TrxC [Cocleimonas sp.]
MSEIQQIVCSNCQGINRVPSQRLGDAPHCGKCKSILLTGKPVNLDDTNFIKIITKNSLPVIVDFWAEWCGPCKMMAPAFSDAANALKTRAILAKLNTKKAQDTAARFSIRSIPTMIAFKEGKEVGRQSGVMNKEQIVQWIRSIS